MAVVAYSVTFNNGKLKEFEYTQDEIDFILEHFKVQSLTDLSNPNRFVFDNYDLKEIFLQRYYNAKNSYLHTLTASALRGLPCILNRRHCLILTAMNAKTDTVSKKLIKDLKIGDLFNLYDQTHFITCKLKNLTPIVENGVQFYKYDYSIHS